jgi:hypothetical protein
MDGYLADDFVHGGSVGGEGTSAAGRDRIREANAGD